MEHPYHHRKKSGCKSVVRGLLVLLIFLVLIVIGILFIWKLYLSPVSSSSSQKEFVVDKNESVSSIAQRLKEEGLIRSDLVFKIISKISGKATTLQPGSYNLSPKMTVEEILNILQKANSTDKKVTLLEGWRVEEMAEKLQSELGISKQDFLLVSKEGYMFPDTYFFKKDVTALEVANKLKDNFNDKYNDSLKREITGQGLTAAEGVILASIVEREASSKDRQGVASVLFKRYRIGMKLDADATVQYALGYQTSDKTWWKKSLLYADLTVNSPYNTYINNGLPPAPICNPSLSALEAVANADSSTPYLFYFHDSKGNIYYAKTLEEHNQNIATYR